MGIPAYDFLIPRNGYWPHFRWQPSDFKCKEIAGNVTCQYLNLIQVVFILKKTDTHTHTHIPHPYLLGHALCVHWCYARGSPGFDQMERFFALVVISSVACSL